MSDASTPIDELELSMRSSEVLRALGIATLGQLLEHTAAQLLAAEGGNGSIVAEIEDVLDELDLALADAADP